MDRAGNDRRSLPARPLGERLRRSDLLLLLAVSLLTLIPGTIAVSLFDRDEGWYAQISREMLQTGDWLVPRYLGEVWLAKPPLLYWLVAASFSAFGVGDWQARLVPVLASCGNVLLVAALGARLFDRRVGRTAGLLFATATLPIIVGKMLLHDAVMLTCVLVAVRAFWRIVAEGGAHRQALVCWLAIGLGLLTKGPAVPVFAGAFGLALLVSPRWRQGLANVRLWLWSPLALVVALPWYFYIAEHAGDTLWARFIGTEILSRFAGAPHGQTGPPGYHVLVASVGLLPWTVLVPLALVQAFKRRREEPVARLLLIWLVVPWLALELIRSKLPHYCLPCYVPVAILLAWSLQFEIGQARCWAQLRRGTRTILNLAMATAVVSGVAMLVVTVAFWDPLWGKPALAIGGILLLGSALTGHLAYRYTPSKGIAGVLGTAIAFHLAVGLWLLPSLEPLRLSRNLAERINREAQPAEIILLCGYKEPTVFFYLEPPAKPIGREALPGLLSDRGGAVLLAVTERTLEEVEPASQEALRGQTIGPPLEGLDYGRMRPERIHVVRIPARDR